MVSKGFPNVTTSGRQYTIGEKPSVILYTYINLHAGTPKPQSFLSKRVVDYSVAIWSYMVLEKFKLNLINISIYQYMIDRLNSHIIS